MGWCLTALDRRRLMVAGIALQGVVTASFATWLVQRVAEIEEQSKAATRRDVAALREEIAAMREEVARVLGHHRSNDEAS
jgi:hypothetical protein